ncbi:MAG: hypothetical protein KJO82_10530 [Gammaproteobacteria bacterium]|nr:hypothetical protein [Gammaproteobacteria bacterium]
MVVERRRALGFVIATGLLCTLLSCELWPHGGDNWDPFTIDSVNDSARIEIAKVQGVMADVLRGRAGRDGWPVTGLVEQRDALLTAKELVDEILEHYAFEGVNVQYLPALHAEPRAGRTYAASRALDAGIAIIDHAVTLDSADPFIAEFYAGGMTARLIELLDTNADRMDLYAALTTNVE